MKLYIKIKNVDGEEEKFVVSRESKMSAIKYCLDKLPQEFLSCGFSSRIYTSELGFDSDDNEYLDTMKVLKKAGWSNE